MRGAQYVEKGEGKNENIALREKDTGNIREVYKRTGVGVQVKQCKLYMICSALLELSHKGYYSGCLFSFQCTYTIYTCTWNIFLWNILY